MPRPVLTIEGIRLVVDSAQERVARFDPRTGLTRLVTQRQPGIDDAACRTRRPSLSGGSACICSAKEQAERAAAQSEPEILHSDLSALLLELLQWGCHDPAALAWLDQPPAVNLAAARRLLEALSALDGERLSAFGRKMATLGNEPRLAAMLAAAQTDDEAATAARLAAILRGASARRAGGFGRRLFPSADQLAAAGAAADEASGPPRRPARCRRNGGVAGVGLRRSHRPPPRSGGALPAGERHGRDAGRRRRAGPP
ncbi:hypothetical protein LNO36_04960 [Klebsiella variicola subsp. variicola]|nr:hypothetical protein [Klebsiella variicola subsp. variicola]